MKDKALSDPVSKQLEKFLKKLRRVKHSETVFNPYRQRHAVHNLRIYLSLLLRQPSVNMLIGEAPGYLGCRLTGIPFSSSVQLMNSEHPQLVLIKDDLQLKNQASEATANYMWDYLQDKKSIPLCWNAFPFHPHLSNQVKSNRAPNAGEIAAGQEYLLDLYELFEPKKVASVGRKGEKALRMAFPDQEPIYIRHPSYGGKRDFISGMNNLLSL